MTDRVETISRNQHTLAVVLEEVAVVVARQSIQSQHQLQELLGGTPMDMEMLVERLVRLLVAMAIGGELEVVEQVQLVVLLLSLVIQEALVVTVVMERTCFIR